MDFTNENDLEFEFSEKLNATQTDLATSAVVRRKYDRTLFARGRAARDTLEVNLQKDIERRLELMPEATAGMTYRVKVLAIPKGTPGASKVLTALIDLVLSHRGSMLTQTACREDVQVRFPGFAVYKDWTKELPAWALKHAKKSVLMAAAPLSGLMLKKGYSLRDLHRAARVACSKSLSDALTVKATVTVTSDALLINGHSFKLTVNRSNGKSYSQFRISTNALMQALKS